MQLVPIVQQTANPNHPSASAAWTNCCASASLSLGMSCPPRAPLLCAIFQHRGRDSKPLTGTVASCAWCGWREDSHFGPRAAMHTACLGLSGWPSTTQAPWRFAHPSCAEYRGDPIGVPRTVMPSGCQASGPKISTFSGTMPAWFHVFVLPWCNWLPACLESASVNTLWRCCTRDGRQSRQMSSRKAHNCSPGSKERATSSNALCIPMENRSGISGSPCSPPSA